MKSKPHDISDAGRAAMQENGRRSAGVPAQPRLTPEELRKDAEEFQAGLLADLGQDITYSQRALVLSATTTRTAILLTGNVLLSTRRFRRLDRTLDRLSRLQGQFHRTLRALKKPEAPAPRTINDILAEETNAETK